MAGRGAQTFKKRQKEQQRKERQQEKLARRLQRSKENRTSVPPEPDASLETTQSSDSAGDDHIDPTGDTNV